MRVSPHLRLHNDALSHQAKQGVVPVPKKPVEKKPPRTLKAKPRSKGNRAEREVIDILRAHGYQARRNFQSGGQGGGDILGGPDGFHLEVKHRETTKIWDWITQAEDERRATQTPLVIFRRNGAQWMCCLPFEDILGLIEAAT
jgi:hypothetical protein